MCGGLPAARLKTYSDRFPASRTHYNAVAEIGGRFGRRFLYSWVMAPIPSATAQIRPARTDEAAEALSLLYRSRRDEDRYAEVAAGLTSLRSGRVASESLFVACRGGQLVGVVWAILAPGRTAVVVPPQITSGEPEETATALFDRADRFLTGAEVRLAQSLLVRGDRAAEQRLTQSGFQRAAEMSYMACLLSESHSTAPTSELTFVQYRPEQRARLAELIEQTYVGTLDCPALNGLRRIEDVVDGYRATGSSGHRYWYFAQSQQRDVGCLLLADFPEYDQMELVYTGLVPSARGMGLGRVLTHQAQWIARRIGRSRMVLGVDTDNGPAIRTYVSAGFFACDERVVWIKHW